MRRIRSAVSELTKRNLNFGGQCTHCAHFVFAKKFLCGAVGLFVVAQSALFDLFDFSVRTLRPLFCRKLTVTLVRFVVRVSVFEGICQFAQCCCRPSAFGEKLSDLFVHLDDSIFQTGDDSLSAEDSLLQSLVLVSKALVEFLELLASPSAVSIV